MCGSMSGGCGPSVSGKPNFERCVPQTSHPVNPPCGEGREVWEGLLGALAFMLILNHNTQYCTQFMNGLLLHTHTHTHTHTVTHTHTHTRYTAMSERTRAVFARYVCPSPRVLLGMARQKSQPYHMNQLFRRVATTLSLRPGPFMMSYHGVTAFQVARVSQSLAHTRHTYTHICLTQAPMYRTAQVRP